MTILVAPSGSLRQVEGRGPDLRGLGPHARRRASRVEPMNPALRALFRALRARVADDSALAAWTRRWPCRWRADLQLSGGPALGPFDRRSDAIAAEVAWLEADGFGADRA